LGMAQLQERRRIAGVGGVKATPARERERAPVRGRVGQMNAPRKF